MKDYKYLAKEDKSPLIGAIAETLAFTASLLLLIYILAGAV